MSRALAALPAVPPNVLRHIGLYAYRAKFLRIYPTLAQAPIEEAEALEQLRALWHGERIAVLVTHDAPPPGVDTPADLARVQALFQRKLTARLRRATRVNPAHAR